MPREIDLDDFLRRVERFCDFFLDKIPVKDGSDDIAEIQNLKDDAADLQNNRETLSIDGLRIYMRGG